MLPRSFAARITEDEETARAAPPGSWKWSDHGHSARLWSEEAGGEPRVVLEVGQDGIWSGPGDEPGGWISSTGTARHIARHDPARVLRECAARRRILGRHQKIDIGSRGQPCLRCAHCMQGGYVAWLCEDITDLAATWADHPDWPALRSAI